MGARYRLGIRLSYGPARLHRGLQRDVVFFAWPIAPSYMSPNAGGRGGVARSQPMSTAVHRSPNKLWRSNSIFYLWGMDSLESIHGLLKSLKFGIWMHKGRLIFGNRILNYQHLALCVYQLKEVGGRGGMLRMDCYRACAPVKLHLLCTL